MSDLNSEKTVHAVADIEATRRRLADYDRDGAIAAAAPELARMIADHCQDIADTFLAPFLGDQAVIDAAGTMSADAYVRQRRESADYVRRKYDEPLSAAWIGMALRNAARCHK